MASQNNEESVPESWDDPSGGIGDSAAQLAKDISSKLNVNAPVFMPGQNVFAPAFVPLQVPDEEVPDSAELPNVEGVYEDVSDNRITRFSLSLKVLLNSLPLIT